MVTVRPAAARRIFSVVTRFADAPGPRAGMEAFEPFPAVSFRGPVACTEIGAESNPPPLEAWTGMRSTRPAIARRGASTRNPTLAGRWTVALPERSVDWGSMPPPAKSQAVRFPGESPRGRKVTVTSQLSPGSTITVHSFPVTAKDDASGPATYAPGAKGTDPVDFTVKVWLFPPLVSPSGALPKSKAGSVISTVSAPVGITNVGFAFKDYAQVWPAIDGALGKGAMGIVYEGRDPVIDREGYDRLHAAMRSAGALSRDIPFENVVDTSLARRAIRA